MDQLEAKHGLKQAAAGAATASPAAVSSSAAAERWLLCDSASSHSRGVEQQLSLTPVEFKKLLQESEGEESGDLQASAKQKARTGAASVAAAAPSSLASAVAFATSEAKTEPGGGSELNPGTASAASSSSGRISQCKALDRDSLSGALSFLDSVDFSHAIRVCKVWRAAGTYKAAWPGFSLLTIIRSLQDGDGRARQLAVKSANQLTSLLSNQARISRWRHVADLLMSRCAPTMQHLSAFSGVIALTLRNCHLSGDLIEGIDDSFIQRLQALHLSSRTGSEHAVLQLARFDQLRVLVIDCLPDPLALSKLLQLTYLGFTHNSRTSRLSDNHATVCLTVARWLSVNHQLRSLAIGQGSDLSAAAYAKALLKTSTPACQTEGADLQSDADSDSKSEANSPVIANLRPPLDQQQACGLTDLSADDSFSQSLVEMDVPFLSFLPSLTRMQWVQSHPKLLFVRPASSKFADFAHLQSVRLDVQRGPWGEVPCLTLLDSLSTCTGLRHFQVSAPLDTVPPAPRPQLIPDRRLKPIDDKMLQHLLAAWRGSIESVRIQRGIRIDFQDSIAGAGPSGRNGLELALIECTKLQLLELSLQANIPAELFHAISRLPRFRILKLNCLEPELTMPANLLQCMVASKSWIVAHFRDFYMAEHKSDLSEFIQVGGMASLSSQLKGLSQADFRALKRIRIAYEARYCDDVSDRDGYASFLIGEGEHANQYEWEEVASL